jgi:hypothetical protein
VSDLGYRAAEQARQDLLAASVTGHGLRARAVAGMDDVRSELVRRLGLDDVPGAEVILSPSGTDCELYALHMALAGHSGRLVNIVIAPDEIGSGSLPAAKGLHFDGVSPLGTEIQAGTPVAGIPTERLHVESLALRGDDGRPVARDELDRRVRQLVAQAVGDGGRALIHLLDSSKTGLRAPSLEAVRALQHEHGRSVLVVVDAAQFRVEADGVAGYVRDGFMVIISGSKFYTGSPFSGALLVPPSIASSVASTDSGPEGFADYLTKSDVPACWPGLRSRLSDVPNLGLLLRWRTALWEMQAYQAVPGHERDEYFDAFRRRVREAIGRYPDLELVDSPVDGAEDDVVRGRWDGLPTIFSFLVHRPDESGRNRPLVYDDARLVYGWLNRDIDALLPDRATSAERVTARKQCHIGQPVRIRRPGGLLLGALRIAVGARFVSRVAFDPTLGPTVPERIAAQVGDVEVVLEKIRLILRHWDVLCREARR